jgi:hypothetical protein
MTERIKGFTVTLERDVREDDFEAILNAVRMIKGVVHVEPSLVTTEDHMNRTMIRIELHDKILCTLRDNKTS